MEKAIKLFLLYVLIFLVPLPGYTQGLEDYRTRIAVVPLVNATGDTAYDGVCGTVSETVSLVLSLLGMYSVLGEAEAFPLHGWTGEPDGNLLTAAADLRVDNILFGSAFLDELGRISFTLSVYDYNEEKVALSRTEAAESIFDIFDTADHITIALLEEFSQVHIGFGTIELVRTSGEGVYSVFLSGQRITNPDTMLKRVLNGEYLLTITQNRLLGETVIFRQDIVVLEDRTIKVEFEIPRATAEETVYMEEKRQVLTALPPEPKSLEPLLREMADFQALTAAVTYDPEMIEERNTILSQTAEKTAGIIGSIYSEGDARFYARRPDFSRAQSIYGELSALINDTYRIERADTESLENPMALPARIALSETGYIYVVDNYNLSVRIIRFSPQGNADKEVYIGENPNHLQIGDIALLPNGNIAFFNPVTSDIGIYSPDLNKLKSLSLPENSIQTPEHAVFTVSPQGVFFLIQQGKILVFDQEETRYENVEAAILRELPEDHPGNIIFDSLGMLYVFYPELGRVYKFSYLGEPQGVVDFPYLENPFRCAVDSLGYFFISQPDRHEILKFDPFGTLITSFGSYGSDLGRMSRPEVMAVCPEGKMIIADTYNDRVQIYTPVSPPVLNPEISHLGVVLRYRDETAQRAVTRMGQIPREYPAGRIASQLFQFTAWMGVLGGVSFLEFWTLEEAEGLYELYSESTDPEEITAHRNRIELLLAGSLVSRYLGYGAVTGSFSSLTNFILSSSDRLTAPRRTIREIQSFSMDYEYTLDRAQYRSLRKARRIGAVTGILPPVIGWIALPTVDIILESYIPNELAAWDQFPVYYYAFLAGSVAIPPIFSHLYSGRFHGGLFLTGLVADALIAGGIYLSLTRPDTWEPGPSPFPETTPYYDVLNSAYGTLLRRLPSYLLYSALAVRLTAGIYDTQRGWKEARTHNQFRAVEPAKPRFSMDLCPYFDEKGNPGLALAVKF